VLVVQTPGALRPQSANDLTNADGVPDDAQQISAEREREDLVRDSYRIAKQARSADRMSENRGERHAPVPCRCPNRKLDIAEQFGFRRHRHQLGASRGVLRLADRTSNHAVCRSELSLVAARRAGL
jgi:hypothetical protein